MPIRHPAKTALGSMLAIAILAAPGIASAQSLFGTPAPDTSSTPASSTPPAAPAKAKKPVAKKTPSPVATPASSTPAAAAPAKAKKPVAKKMPAKPVVPKFMTKITVINNREATLVALMVTSMTAKNSKPIVVAHDLKSSQKASSPLAKTGGCIYDVSGSFDDGSTIEQSAVDFCKDANLNLVE